MEWNTPKHLANAINDMFFPICSPLDPCSNDDSLINAKTKYFEKDKQSGLDRSWDAKTIFCNPPFHDNTHDTHIGEWIEKCAQSRKYYNAEIIAFAPVYGKTRSYGEIQEMWFDHIFGVASAICFLKEKCSGYANGKSVKKPYAIIYYGDRINAFRAGFSSFGYVADIRMQKFFGKTWEDITDGFNYPGYTSHKYEDAINETFGDIPDLDPCTDSQSIIKTKKQYVKNGLDQGWKHGTIYLNPPTGIDATDGNGLDKWIAKAAKVNSEFDSQILALIPVGETTNTHVWQKNVFGKAAGACFLSESYRKRTTKNRLQYVSCAMIYYGSKFDRFFNAFKKHGAVVDLRNE